jgi:hypothetical protein
MYTVVRISGILIYVSSNIFILLYFVVTYVTVLCDRGTYITEMNTAMPTAPSAPLYENQELVGHHGPPPPSYEQAVGQGQIIPPVVQPAVAPYPHQNSK